MKTGLPSWFKIDPEVSSALHAGQPVVALESTVITHGLPYPDNMQLARDMEQEVRQGGAVPATIAVIAGRVAIGVAPEELALLARGEGMHKISTRDFAAAAAKGWNGGTTVAGTMTAAHAAGIKVFATGGIGGVHRDAPFDISADLPQLARTPMIVVCAGAKAILDLPATLEYLETFHVPVVGMGTDEFPAFYSRESGLPVSVRADSAAEVVDIACAHWELGLNSALLVVVPPPAEAALPYDRVARDVDQALAEAREAGVRGQAVTPFLLSRMAEITGGASLQANLALLRNNARYAAQIARALVARR
ncbi:MAG: pseudouridine-5'-phosphate glycosidase [Chloroflexi bacterium]|mgnify:CR=1 FL=1|jgi:pseudouridine-5'-phosphate glycosidase|nr:pseudouridine-5'-phosphate glycosidase [Chloroflexota bacterium]